jgi:hypothetical protein
LTDLDVLAKRYQERITSLENELNEEKRKLDQVPTEWVNVTAFESKIRQHTS